MIIDTVLIRDGEVIVKHDQGQETGLDAVLHDCFMLGHYEKMYSLCRRLAALAVQEHTHREQWRTHFNQQYESRQAAQAAIDIHAGGSDDDN